MIRIKCPKCQKVLGLDDSTAGGPALCPACKQKFMVPGTAKAAAAGKPAAKAGADKDTWKKPGAEDDDFTPYKIQDTGPPKKVEDKSIDDMVRFALRQKQRDKAWAQVGLPAKMLKIWTLVVLGINIVCFLYFSLVCILFLHKQKQGIAASPLFPFNDIPAANFHAAYWFIGLGVFVVLCGICGVVLAGLEKMKKLESWGFALAGNIVAMVFLLFFGLVFGAWGLSVLLNKDVKAEFYKKPGMAGMEQDLAEEEAEDEDDDEDYDDEDEDEE